MANRKSDRLHFVSSQTDAADKATELLIARYGQSDENKADVIVTLGGDGFMLATAHKFMNSNIPIYGMNRGSIGFLMNEFAEENLHERIANAICETIRPLHMLAEDMNGQVTEALAINEVSLFRQSYQAAKIKINVDQKTRMEELICDGVMIASPAGSTAYNLSAQGPIIPLDSPLLALTPVSPFRPRRWRGALLPNTANIEFEVLENEKRPVNAVADHTEVKSVKRVTVTETRGVTSMLLFDADHSWEERILSEQFKY